jgi:MoxR-like ATPase
LQELDRMSFDVYETQERITAVERPIVVITSNNEKELPDAFLRRCFFHYIKFPDRDTMQAIIDVHFPGIQKTLVSRRWISSTKSAMSRASRRSLRPANCSIG